MAGGGRKNFCDGEVFSPADVNDYLMDQAVMRFADSAARSSAIGTPTEGMVSYLDDTNDVEVYDGTGWVNFTGDITNITAGTALNGGGSEGAVTLDVNIADISSAQAGTALVATGETLDVNIAAISTAQAGTAIVASGEVLNVDLSVIDIPVSQITDITVSASEINSLDGISSNVQTQLNGKVDESDGSVTQATAGSAVVRNITLSTSSPSGGSDGDVWLVYTP